VTLLELENVSSFYGDVQALFDVSLSVDEGETVAIIGANGAGKSTVLGTIMGLLRPRSGHVRFEGASIKELPVFKRVARGVSLVPEGQRIFPSLSVHEHLEVGRYLGRAGAWDSDRVYELFPNLGRMRSRSASSLSGGERQALAIGRALMANPRLLLLDEVSLGLAPRVIKELYEAIPGIVESGITLLVVEQDVGQALAAADRVYCLLEGRISLHESASEVSRDEITSAYFGM
jgi:branched-chain amino acid transport system ATP-binding protein